MSSTPDNGKETRRIEDVPLPMDLKKWAEKVDLGSIEVHVSDIAWCATFKLPKMSPSRLHEQAPRIRHLAQVLREAGREARKPWPLVIILDASEPLGLKSGTEAEPEKGEEWKQWHRAVEELSADQEWHAGDLSLYLVPVVAPGTEGWKGPRTAHELRDFLLDVGAQVRELPDARQVGWEELKSALEKVPKPLPPDLGEAVGRLRDAPRDERRKAIEAFGGWAERKRRGGRDA